MALSSLMSGLLSKQWRSSGKSTVHNREYNNYPEGDWRRKLIEAKNDYYPPENVDIEIVQSNIIREAYSVDSSSGTIYVPRVELEAFRMEVTGDDFAGKKALRSARFIVNSDHAVSNPLLVLPSLSVVVHVRLRTLDSGRLTMVNELVWSMESESEDAGSQKFYDIQKWFCCGYP